MGTLHLGGWSLGAHHSGEEKRTQTREQKGANIFLVFGQWTSPTSLPQKQLSCSPVTVTTQIWVDSQVSWRGVTHSPSRNLLGLPTNMLITTLIQAWSSPTPSMACDILPGNDAASTAQTPFCQGELRREFTVLCGTIRPVFGYFIFMFKLHCLLGLGLVSKQRLWFPARPGLPSCLPAARWPF